MSLEIETDLTAARSFKGSANINTETEAAMSLFMGVYGNANLKLTSSGLMSIPRPIEGIANISVAADNADMIRGRTFEHLEIAINSGCELSERMNLSAALSGIADMSLDPAGELNAAVSYIGSAVISLETLADLNKAHGLQGDADIGLAAAGTLNTAVPFRGNPDMAFTAGGHLNRVFGLGGNSNIIFAVYNEGFNIFRYEHIHLSGLNIPVGGEIIIDTENMTITLNGQNVMRHLSRDSEFFLLNPARNELVYTTANQNDRADIRVLWRDAWV